ncbi:hypothetical protein GCM10025771_08720 [Niveibacterium umoris]|uniref:Uncharacterized protein n=1 Tax=Niveibacterium umoris TaxID=1193620 RepID=A0A840BQ30_9RHOO|nr:hypothetical protein [Niveibacterium umoris]MBB4013579.1 hypothetical protein [Niveibacterium umoris]
MSSINGIGTTYIGCSAIGRDGSYVTTKWLSIVMPIVPLGSYRILPQSHETRHFPIYHSSAEFLATPVPLCWLHLLQVYGTYLAIVVFLSAIDLVDRNNAAGRVALHPFLSAILAAAFSVLAVRITRGIRRIGTLTNIIILLAVLTFSFLLASGMSKVPEQSWKTMYFFWGGYALLALIGFPGGKGAGHAQRKPSRR